MDEIDPFRDPPLYEHTQVLTLYDIAAVRNGYIYQYQLARWYQFTLKWKFLVGVGVCNEMLHWLAHGKPTGGVVCKEEHNGV